MNSKNPNGNSRERTDTLPVFRILVVDDAKLYLDLLCDGFRRYASAYYELVIFTAESSDDGMALLKASLMDGQPFDVVLLDYYLPERVGLNPVKDLSLPRFCIQHKGVCHWVAQLTGWSTDPDLIKLWSDFNLAELSVRLVQKNPENLLNLARAIFFREVTIPLRSAWLAAQLGTIESVMGRQDSPPKGFDIYRFVRRMGEVWPRLDPDTKNRAHELFSIELGDHEMDRPKRIGFKSFTHR